MELGFLDDIDLQELEGKDEIVKSVRFSKEEFYLLKYLQYKNKKFSYVKDLIQKDLDETISPTISKGDIKQLIKESLREDVELQNIIRDILKEDNYNIEITEKTKENNDEEKQDLLDFMGR